MSRPKIPKPLERRLLYESAYVCVVCQSSGCQIHHIDQNHSNNSENNLVVLCLKHHDEAHTKRQLSKNLDPKAIKDAKTTWVSNVEQRRKIAATASGQIDHVGKNSFHAVGITWGYINHKRVAQMSDPSRLDVDTKQYFEYCVSKRLLDQNAIVIKPQNTVTPTSPTNATVYDWYEFGDDQRVHKVYSDLVDQISGGNSVFHLDNDSWAKTSIKELIKPGQIIFTNRAFYFKTIETRNYNEHRRCRTFKRKIEIEFYIDTLDMFGVTSIAVSFSGHKNAAALVQVKSLEETKEGKLILHCTPIALGVGFENLK